MRVPLSWLREYVDIDLPVPELAELLTNAGLEVEKIEFIGLPGADLEWDRERIVLAQILKVEQHPDADRLVLATVEYGAAEPKVAVTGAPNLLPYVGRGDLSAEGLYAPYALEGATLYDGHKDGRVKTKLKGRPLRGIYNDSMLCSEKELGISEEHDGIILVTSDELRVTSEEAEATSDESQVTSEEEAAVDEEQTTEEEGQPADDGVDAQVAFVPHEVLEGALQLRALRPNIDKLYYRPSGGLSYQDGRGWRAYFGVGQDMHQKLVVYETVVAQLMERGIRPEYISVSNQYKPYYRALP